MSARSNSFCFLTICLLGLSAVAYFAEGQSTIVVEAGDLGKIKGLKVIANRGTPYYAFSGIPYGVEPSVTKRFKPSELRTGPLLPNGEVFNATRLGVICPQKELIGAPEIDESGDEALLRTLLDHPSSELNRSMFGIPEYDPTRANTMAMGSEDCLILNINTPFIPEGEPQPEELLPVIVYLHGGSFMSFWSALFNGGRFLNNKVLLVSINYRLGVLGFFNLGINDAPGNAGLYDAKTALEWIQKYIKHFGGDPNRVIITGQSAGAAAVVHLMGNPALTQGLFHGVIACSGTAFQEWAITDDPIKHSLIIAEKLECYDSNSPDPIDKQKIVECMQGKPVDDIVLALTRYRNEDRKNAGLGFHAGCPSIQSSPDITIPKLIPEDPFKVFTEGRQLNVPIITGTTRHDGSFVLQEAYDDYLIPNGLENNSTYIRTQLLGDILTIMGMEDKTYGVIQAIADSFIGDSKYSDELKPLFPGLIDMFSVFFYKALGYRTAEFQAKIQPKSYVFSFDHKGTWSLHALTNIGGPIRGGVSHTDDQIYLFQWLPLITQKDKDVANRWVQMWINFAYHLNPNGADDGDLEDDSWPPFPKYLRIGTYGQELIDTVGETYRDDWKHISYDLYPLPAPPTTTENEPTGSDSPTPTKGSATTEAESTQSTTENANSQLRPVLMLIPALLLLAARFNF